MTSVPIHQILENGELRRLGDWVHSERRLELSTDGFPMLSVGNHRLDGDLPWLFWDMCPSGFLGKRFARVERQLSLNSDPRTWSRDEALRALTEAGDDLPGNLIVGEHSLERWRTHREREDAWELEAQRFHLGQVDRVPGLERRADGSVLRTRRPWDPPAEIDDWLHSSEGSEFTFGSSSLGGERPKLATRGREACSLRKFSPPVPPPDSLRGQLQSEPGLRLPESTPQAQRWADLLRVEAHCAQTLRASGVPSVEARIGYSLAGRVVLELVRFDRTAGWGRRGACTLYWYAMDHFGDVSLPAPRVVERLVTENHLPSSATLLVERVHSFSSVIGNTDAHLGNYGLVFDEAGRAALAPFYDILPMALAPANDELPDARVTSRAIEPLDSTVERWVEELVDRVSGDETITASFRALWFHLMGR